MRDDHREFEYPAEDTLGDQWRRCATDEWKQLLSDSSPAGVSLHDRVSRLAYQFYLRRGKVSGHDLDDWFAAERVVRLGRADTKDGSGAQINGKEK